MATFPVITLFILFGQIILVLCQPTVRVEQGLIQGKTEHLESDYFEIQRDVDVFLGIPYAEPPVGERRFAAPLPKEPWGNDEAYNATYNRDICVQTSSEASYFLQSEDCLHLNVYAPNPMVSRPSECRMHVRYGVRGRVNMVNLQLKMFVTECMGKNHSQKHIGRLTLAG